MSSPESQKMPEANPAPSTGFPGGTVTFLFTDIAGSTELIKRLREKYTLALAEHRRILREIITSWNGHEVDTQGDAFFFSFARATQAVAAAVEAQRSLTSYPWPEGIKLHVRMGLHTGEPWEGDQGYVGIDVTRAARIAHAGHGGQVLISETTTALVIDELPQGVSLLDLGNHLLKDLLRPEHIHQLVIEDLPYKFPPLKSLGALPSEKSTIPESDSQPAFMQKDRRFSETKPVFVGREVELKKLESHLKQTLSGQGEVVFIKGDPGRGKSALMHQFSHLAMQHYPDLVVASGYCDAYSGVGDPYLPFRDILAMLSGDLEMRWSAGLISGEQARRIWNILPETIMVMMNSGPELINRLLSARELLGRAQQIGVVPPETLGRLHVMVQQSLGSPSQSPIDQVALFGQFANVLTKLAEHHPLVLCLDDLQWMDIGSINLLFHLGRRLAGSQILLICAYRSEDVALGRQGERHPLEELMAEFKRKFGDIWIDLDNCDARQEQQFVEAFLDTEPNLLSPAFRQAFFKHTEGHPLFTIELLRNLQEQGVLAQDAEGRWIEKGRINWQAIPSKVEGVIEERIGRLHHEQREILTIASVEGEEFIAQVVARILNLEENGLFRILNQSLDRQHRLITDRGTERLGDKILVLFAFRHNLFQKYLYDQLNQSERIMHHEAVGEALEAIYSGYTDKISPQLARHFDLAGMVKKAIHYYLQAGKYAMRVSAHHEVIAHIQRALTLLNTLPASPERSSQELDLQLILPPSLTAVKGWAAPELGAVYDRALQLCSDLTDDAQLVRTLWLMSIYLMGRSEYDKVDNVNKQLSSIVQRTGDPRWNWMSKYLVYQFYQGHFLKIQENLESIFQQYEPNEARNLALNYGMAPGIVGAAYLSNCEWLLGLPEKAIATIQEALKRVEEINIPMITCYVLSRACWTYLQLDEYQTLYILAERLLKISQEHHLKSFEYGATFYIHASRVFAGLMAGGEIKQMYEAMETYSATGTILNRTAWLVSYAEACTAVRETERGLAAADESIKLGDRTGELWIQAEAHRLKGELLLQLSSSDEVSFAEAENCFLRAREIARNQAARSLELRAAISYFRLSKVWDKPSQARQMLEEVYASFAEGWDTPDLLEARTLLDT